jgi:hypothetical protein
VPIAIAPILAFRWSRRGIGRELTEERDPPEHVVDTMTAFVHHGMGGQ